MALPLVRSACAAALLAGSAMAQNTLLRYDAALGTLPTAQGFLLRDDGASPAAQVRDGALWQGPTDMETQQYWYAAHGIDFTRGVVVEGMINVASSTYRLWDCAGALRTGYYLGAVDNEGRMAYLAIADGRITVLTSANQVPTPETPVVNLAMQNVWRDVKMVIRSSGIELWVDGEMLAGYPLGAAAAARAGGRVLFGDGTSCGSSRTQLRWAEVGPIVECAADFNEDGFVDFADYDDFVTCFEGEWCPAGKSADINEDGFVDLFDYDAFLEIFESGCNGGNPGGGGDGTEGGGGGGAGGVGGGV